MDYEKIERALVDRVSESYREFMAANPTPTMEIESGAAGAAAKRQELREMIRVHNRALHAYQGRYSTLLKRVRAHRTWLAQREAKRAQVESLFVWLERAHKVMKSGGTIVSFDVERGYPNEEFPIGQLREIGITVLRKGKLTSYNYRAVEAAGRKTYWVKFDFGRTIQIPEKDILVRLLEETAKADMYVGHSIQQADISYLNDLLDYLGMDRVPERPVLDTFLLAGINPKFASNALHGATLTSVAAEYGVIVQNAHCGGNDARYNMELLQVMVKKHVRKPPSAMVGAVSLAISRVWKIVGSFFDDFAPSSFGPNYDGSKTPT